MYLARHLSLNVSRVIKRVSKDSVYGDSFYRETGILKDIRHESIPTIFDIEEDNDNYYIIEEFIDGINLYDLITEQGILAESVAVIYGIQLSKLITFLHSREPEPILFLDLQPKNIIIKDEKLYLIDFGNSSVGDEANYRKILMGTPGFAAPEQYSGTAGMQTDIYGIGALLYFMVTGEIMLDHEIGCSFNKNISHMFKDIILRCLENQERLRFSSASKINQQLQLLHKKKCEAYKENKPLVISVAGMDTRIGTTHIALLMSRFLKNMGIDTLYEENNDSNHVRKIAGLHSDCIYSQGTFIYKKLRLIPKYSNNVYLEFDSEIVVRDEGEYRVDKKYGDLLFIVAGTREWDLYFAKEFLQDDPQYAGIIFNLSDDEQYRNAINYLDVAGYKMPFSPNIHQLDKITADFYNDLLKEVLQSRREPEKKKKYWTPLGIIQKWRDKNHRYNWRS